jgi:hypothetical protein
VLEEKDGEEASEASEEEATASSQSALRRTRSQNSEAEGGFEYMIHS